MADGYKIELTPEGKAAVEALKDSSQKLLPAFAKALDAQNGITVALIMRKYMSFPSDGPAVAIGVRQISGSMKRGTRWNAASISGGAVESSIGCYVRSKGFNYALAHEFGAEIPPHKIVAKGGALKFQIGDRVIYAKSVQFPGATLPARRPIGRGIEDRREQYKTALSNAAVAALEQG